MRSLRLPGETDQEFRSRAERTVIIAKHLIDAALANYCIQHFIADPALSDDLRRGDYPVTGLMET